MRVKHLPKILTVAGTIAFALSAAAATLTPEQALSRATSQMRKVGGTGDKMHLAYTVNIANTSTPAIYVFSRENHYMILSADDNAEPILGYADDSFDADNIPPSMQWWLDEYARQIKAVEGSNQPYSRAASAERAPIAPMITTRWDQSEPYNNKCPIISGRRSMTGCLATALAQVLKYHSWPERGTGSYSYRQGLTTISFNYGETVFDWDNMLDTYTNSATDAQNDTVATLMFGCGVGVNMRYGANASGASDAFVPGALINYFNYDKGMRYLARDCYSISQWENVIYNSLVEYGPVLYCGQSNEGGHAFVCDGYSNDGFFHFNWGWGGMSDGYFRLTALNPGQQGTGGSLSGFNFNQSIIDGITKPREGSVIAPNIILTSDLTLPADTRYGRVIEVEGSFVNYGMDVTGNLGLKFVDNATGETTYSVGASLGSGLSTGYGVSGYGVSAPMKKNGTYTVTTAFRDSNNEWYDIPAYYNAVSAYTATVDRPTITFTPITASSIEVSNLDLVLPIYLGQNFELKAMAKNTGSRDYSAIVAPAILDAANNVVAFGDYMPLEIGSGETTEIDYFGKMVNYVNDVVPSAGDYNLCFIETMSQKIISDIINVPVRASMSPRIGISSLRLVGGGDNANGADLEFVATARGNGGYFCGSLQVVIFPAEGDYSVATLPTNNIVLSLGKSEEITAKGEITDAEIGGKYWALVYNGQEPLSSSIYEFTVTRFEQSGITSPEAGAFTVSPNPADGVAHFSELATDIQVYNLSGAIVTAADQAESVDLSALPAGMYLLKATPESTGTPTTVRIIRK